MTRATRGTIQALTRTAAPVAILLLAFATLFCFPPDRFPIYPPCPIFTLFHLQCPGCGATRALAALLHFHFTEAMRLNALFTIAFPFALIWASRCYLRCLNRTPIRSPQPSHRALYVAFAITALFTIARNL